MSLEIRPLGDACNLACTYCYQNPQRQTSEASGVYNLRAITAAIDEQKVPFSLFGGEALLTPIGDLETLWKHGFERFRSNMVQTNGTLITAEHVELFAKYNVTVGISMDGPGVCNSLRRAGDAGATEAATAVIQSNIDRLCRRGLKVYVIITLHRENASPERLPLLLDWVRHLDTLGVRGVRLHVLESENATIRQQYGLSQDESLAAFLAFADLGPQLSRVQMDVFKDIERMLLADDREATCIWRGCDPYTTAAVTGIEGDGSKTNCGRTYKDGIAFVKAEAPGYERYIALYHTPQEFGGCQGCRYFVCCKGQCPGTAIDGDWRNRSADCDLWKALMTRVESRLMADGRQPITASRQLPVFEEQLLAAWQRRTNPTLSAIKAGLEM